MNKFVVDIQGFQDLNNKFIIKELAIYDGRELHHTLFKPPHPFHKLPPHIKKTNNWLTTYYHNLQWKDGSTPYNQLLPVVSKIISPGDIIYVKGLEKSIFLRNLIGDNTSVIQLPENPRLHKSEPQCLYHKNKSLAMCAITNVLFLYNTFVNNM